MAVDGVGIGSGMRNEAGAMPVGRHAIETLRLAGPIIVARAMLLVMFVVDTAMAGWAGAAELAYMGLGVAPQMVLMLVAVGALQSVVVLSAQAQGAGDATGTGRVFRAGLIHAVALGLLVGLLSVFSEPFFRATGQAPDLARGAARVTAAFGWGLPGMLAFTAVNLFLEATGRPRAGMVILILVNIANVPLNGIFGLGWFGLAEPAGAVGCVAVSAALRWVAFLGAIGYLLADEARRGDPRRLVVPASTWLAEIATLGGAAGRQIRAVGLPMGIAQGVESAAFTTIVFVAGTLGTTTLAAHQITMTVVSLIFMMAIGTASATAIRVGRAVGAGAGADAARAGRVGIVIGAVMALPFSVWFLINPDPIGRLYTDDPAVLALTRQTFLVAAFFLSIDAAAAVLMGALRGAGDVWRPTILQTSAYWLAAVPIAAVLAGPGGFGPVGLMGGIVAGAAVSVALLDHRFRRVSRGPLGRL